MIAHPILMENATKRTTNDAITNKKANKSILNDLKYFYTWQLSWRKVLARSVVYIDASMSAHLDDTGYHTSVVPYQEAKKQRAMIKQFCKQFKATVVDFFDSEVVTIVISRRNFSKSEDYCREDIFYSNENFRIWTYEKAMRFFEKLTKKLPIPIDLKIEIQRLQNRIRHDDLKLNEIKRFQMYEQKKKLMKEKMLLLWQQQDKTQHADNHKAQDNQKKIILKQIEIKRIEEENKLRFEKEIFEKQRFEKELEIEKQRIEKVKQLEIEKLNRDKLRIEQEKEKQKRQNLKFEVYSHSSGSSKAKKSVQSKSSKYLRQIHKDTKFSQVKAANNIQKEMIISQHRMNVINNNNNINNNGSHSQSSNINNRTKLINNLCKINNKKGEIIAIAKDFKKKDFKTQVFEMIKSSQHDHSSFQNGRNKIGTKDTKNLMYRNPSYYDYSKKDLATLLNKEKRLGPADRFARTETIHYFEGPYVFIYDMEQRYRPILKAEYGGDPDEVKGGREWSMIVPSVNGHSLFADDSYVNKEGRLAPHREKQKDLAVNDDYVKQEEKNKKSGDFGGMDKQTYNDVTNIDDENAESDFKKRKSLEPKKKHDEDPKNGSKKRKYEDLTNMNASGISQSNTTTNNGNTNDTNGTSNLKNGLGPGQSCVASKEYKMLKKRHTSNKRLKAVDEDANNKNNNSIGYCENCRIRYLEFNKHIKEQKHREFATNQKNFVKIDSFIELLRKGF